MHYWMEANIRFMSDTVILSLFGCCGEYIEKIKVFYIGSKSLTCLYPCSTAMITSIDMRLFECTMFLRIFTLSWNTGYGSSDAVCFIIDRLNVSVICGVNPEVGPVRTCHSSRQYFKPIRYVL